ncbi:MAG: Polysaccharide biosynthesis protein [Solirubrobacterales bacterium]|nr:Polysaccharide biosynthesis protein [Solirubrobacterales bacterium]
MSGLRTIVRNTALQAGGEVLTKLASLAFYVVMARQLGSAGFGDYMFALSLVVLLTSLAGFGTDGLLTREVARDRGELHRLFWNSLALKAGLGVVLTGVALLVAELGDYSAAVSGAIVLLAVGTLLELLAKTIGATFLAYDDLRPVAAGLILQRFTTAAAGIVALLAGAGIVPVAAIYLGGAALGLAYVAQALYRREIRPRRELSLRRARQVAAEAVPFGLMLIFSTIIFRIDATMLSLYKGPEAVGLYSAAYRALESVLFLPYAIENAVFPTFARLGRATQPTLAAVYEGGLKAIVAVTAPLGVTFLLFGGPLLELLYGSEYGSAERAIHWLGGAAVLYGVSFLSVSLLAAQRQTRVLAWTVGGVMLFNIVLNLVVIPRFSLDGAAAVTTITEAVQALALGLLARRFAGRVSARRILTGPVLGAAAMAAVALAAGTGIAAFAAAGATYLVVVVLAERALFPDDLGRFTGVVRARLGRA